MPKSSTVSAFLHGLGVTKRGPCQGGGDRQLYVVSGRPGRSGVRAILDLPWLARQLHCLAGMETTRDREFVFVTCRECGGTYQRLDFLSALHVSVCEAPAEDLVDELFGVRS